MKSILSRIIGGFVIGVLIGQVVQILISLQVGQGTYLPVLDNFRAFFTNETTAFITQIILTGCIGVVFATSSLVFDIAKWGLLKQYMIHFCVTSIVWVPVVMLLWTPETFKNVIIMMISFLATYILTWWIQYTLSKKDIQKINAAIQSKRNEEGGNK
ncbi:DUF3021 domain-containing protein [Psychrobacillus sp. OK032]|jgi:hypothetical protein|uniref:DUF3021 domain-containing protein n=1 Tax=Psychrobacillus sp. OK032 TaxID=1884358 RepID=UPI0008C20516|nr:DUF3021 domain-containing protein [Psychrobacillus sp. OK032]SES45323.1 Protein of unknown function [Psychrobacillus sp. OK032]